MRFEVGWTISGIGTVEVSDDELEASGVDKDQHDGVLFQALNDYFDGDLLMDAVEMFDERDAPEVEYVFRVYTDDDSED